MHAWPQPFQRLHLLVLANVFPFVSALPVVFSFHGRGAPRGFQVLSALLLSGVASAAWVLLRGPLRPPWQELKLLLDRDHILGAREAVAGLELAGFGNNLDEEDRRRVGSNGAQAWQFEVGTRSCPGLGRRTAEKMRTRMIRMGTTMRMKTIMVTIRKMTRMARLRMMTMI